MMLVERKYSWLVVALLWVVALLNYMDRQMLATMQSAMQQDIAELNKAESFGALMAIFLWVYGFISPFAGAVADRVSRKWLIVASLFVWSFVTLLMGYVSSFHQLYILRAIMGVSEALYIPSALSLIADWHEDKSRSLAVGIHNTGLYMGQAIGGFGAVIAANFSWEQTFHGFGIVGIIYSIVLIFFLHESPNRCEQKAEESIKATISVSSMVKAFGVVLSNFSFWILLFYFAAPSLPGWATKNWLPTLFSESLSLPMSQAGPMSTITIAASSFLGVISGGYLSDKWVKINLRGRIYTSAIGLGLTIPSLILLGLGNNAVTVILAGLCFGLGFGMFDANNMPILCQIMSERYRSMAYGIMNMLGVLSGATVTQVLGKMGDQGHLGLGFALLGIVVALAIILQLLFVWPKTDNLVK